MVCKLAPTPEQVVGHRRHAQGIRRRRVTSRPNRQGGSAPRTRSRSSTTPIGRSERTSGCPRTLPSGPLPGRVPRSRFRPRCTRRSSRHRSTTTPGSSRSIEWNWTFGLTLLVADGPRSPPPRGPATFAPEGPQADCRRAGQAAGRRVLPPRPVDRRGPDPIETEGTLGVDLGDDVSLSIATGRSTRPRRRNESESTTRR